LKIWLFEDAFLQSKKIIATSSNFQIFKLSDQTMYYVFAAILILLPFMIIFAIIVRKSSLIQQQLQKLEKQQKKLLQVNTLLELEKDELLEKQDLLDKQLTSYIESNADKQEVLDKYTERQLEFHIIKFGRTAAWGSPAYSVSVDALGNVLYHGKEAVRMIGFFQWKIYRKRIKNINSVIKKSQFFKIKGNKFESEIKDISGVVIEIYLKNGIHKKIKYDHASDYPIDLGFLERKLDIILETKKLWLYWSQNAVKFSIKRGLNYRATFAVNEGVLYTILGQDYFSEEYFHEWKEINDLLLKHEALWTKETSESFKNHPRDSVWVEIETGFRFIISPHKHPDIYNEFAQIVEEFGTYLQQKKSEESK